MSTHQNYWNNKGKHQAIYEMVQVLIPSEGEVSGAHNKALEKLRKAANCYYDVFNNGLCNRAAEFRQVFGFGGTTFAKHFKMDSDDGLLLEAKMDDIIMAAFIEQDNLGNVLTGINEAMVAYTRCIKETASLMVDEESVMQLSSRMHYQTKTLEDCKTSLYRYNQMKQKAA